MGVSAGKPIGPKYSSILEKTLPKEFSDKKEIATFAAGCFWGVELQFQRIPGVLSTSVGYTGGKKDNPTYEQVCRGNTGHTEAVLLEFDSEIVSYNELLDVFWERHNPTTLNRQGNDVGTQYRSAIYYHTEEQKDLAFKSKEEFQKTTTQPIVTEIEPASRFWTAEEHHQQYLEKGGQCSLTGDKTPIRCYG